MKEIPCGCGEYSLYGPEKNAPAELDVLCPECGNRFGWMEDDY